jgi:hypothetical protein
MKFFEISMERITNYKKYQKTFSMKFLVELQGTIPAGENFIWDGPAMAPTAPIAPNGPR